MNDFEMVLPETLDDAVEALPNERTEPLNDQAIRILAGGQDLLHEMKNHVASPGVVVNVKGVDGLERGVRAAEGDRAVFGDGTLEIGALTTLAELARDEAIRAQFPAVAEASESIGTPQVRNQATVAGNLCQRPRCWYYRSSETPCLKKGGDECYSYAGLNKYNAVLGGGPSYIVHPSDLATVFSSFTTAVITTQRVVPLEEFFTLPSESDPTRENVLEPNEVILSIVLDPSSGTAGGWTSTYVKFKERESFDFAVSAVALAVRMQDGVIDAARLTLGAVAPVPWRCPSTEKLLAGRTIDAKLGREAGEDALSGAEPLEFNAYKIPLTRALVGKALERLAE